MTSNLSKWTKASVISTIMLGVVGCTSKGPTSNPFERKFTWLSYIQGSDFSETCSPTHPNQYRLVYNGVYTEQLRTYDLSDSGYLDVQVIGPANLSGLEVSSFSDLLNPWRGKSANRLLTQDQVDLLVESLKKDGAFGPPAEGLELSSKGFFWTIAACHGGAYHFTALSWPSPAWDEAQFDDVIFALDPSAVAVNPPRKTVTRQDMTAGVGEAKPVEFHAKVGKRGLAGFFSFPR
ncbi:MAG: hypothetical protein OQK24_03505 [Magnetovibrio sp.]|nr:hypothetical protein [Magnetovibrio sp.]